MTYRTPPLRTSFGWALAGNGVSAACQWGLLVVVARLGSLEMLGQMALAVAIVSPVSTFTNLSLRAILITDWKGEFTYDEYVGQRLLSTLVSLLVIVGTVSILWANGRTPIVAVTLAIAVGRGIDSVADVYQGMLQKYEAMNRMAMSLIFRGVLSLIVPAVVLPISNNLALSMAILAATSGVVLGIYDVPSARLVLGRVSGQSSRADSATSRVGLSFRLRAMRDLTSVGLPLGVTAMLISLNTGIPRYFLERHGGYSDVGVFAALVGLANAGTVALAAASQTVIPRLSRAYGKRDLQGFVRLLFICTAAAVFMGISGVLVALSAGRLLLGIVFGHQYIPYSGVFLIVMAGAGTTYITWFLGCGATAARYFRIQPWLTGGTVVVTMALCSRLVPRSGITGAAWAVAMSGAVQMIGYGLCDVHAVRRLRRRIVPLSGRDD
jgi:O-antigen/teichoic acid export membrane protein